MGKDIVKICTFDTVYSLFLYFLKFGYNPDDILILSNGVPKQVRNNLNHIYFPDIKLLHDRSSPIKWLYKNIINVIKQVYGVLKLRIILFFKTRGKDVEVYGQGHLTFSYPLYEFENSYIIEDGLGNYLDLKQPTKINPILNKIANFFGIYVFNLKEGFGTHKNIKKVYLTKNNVPFEIKDKAEVMDMDSLWDLKSDDEKNKILKLFNLENSNQWENHLVLLLTEPFSEHDLLPFDEEISIYREFIDKYPNIIIKTHPREKKDYLKLFPDVEVIDVPFPVELLKYIGVNIDKIVTICSTAALNLSKDCEIEIYDKKTSSEHINNSIDVLKRNLKK